MFKKKYQTGIIILEGADASGKTTLAKTIIASNGGEKHCSYYHSGIEPDLWSLAKNFIIAAVAESNHKLVILDRSWISECCYGPIFRNECQFPTAARSLDRLLLKHAAVTVLCVIEDQKWHLNDFECLKLERSEAFKDIEPVVNWYFDLAYGNMARPATNYAETFIARGDLHNRPDFLLYDRTKTSALSQAKKTIKRLKAFRDEQCKTLLKAAEFSAVGHSYYSSVVFIGDNFSDADEPWPFFFSENNKVGKFFNKAMQAISFNEADAMYLDMSRENSGLIAKELRNMGKSFIALSQGAYKFCSKNDIIPIRIPITSLSKYASSDPGMFQEDLRSAICKGKILEIKRRSRNAKTID